MIAEAIVIELSRWQFAVSAMFHFLFIPLTLGLSLVLALMESAYLLSGRDIYKISCQFWKRLFAVNFLLCVATRLTMIFQFGMNGSYFSHYVGDVFALPLAIEAVSTFFVASLLFGPYLFGWERFGKWQHLVISWSIVLAVNVSALWVLIANVWMQNPVGWEFNHQSFRVEMTDFTQLFNNPVATAKALHTVAASYATASATLLAISAWLLINNPNNEMARISYKLVAHLGLAAMLIVAGLGDSTPQQDSPVQQRKLAALEGGDLSAFLPDITARIRNGIKAHTLLQELRDNSTNPEILTDFNHRKADLGYALLLNRWTEHPAKASDKQIALAAQSAIPGPPLLLYWTYRFMIACGILTLLLFLLAVWYTLGTRLQQPWLLRLSLYGSPLPWLACIGGWFIAEAGIQPWAIAEILPTFLSFSSLSAKELIFSLIAYVATDAALLLAGFFLIRQAFRSAISNSASGTVQ